MATITITAQCKCKDHTFTAQVSPSNLPLKAACCHCNSCRRVSGALRTSGASWPGDPGDIASRGGALRRYAFSPKVTLLSCGTCSSPMFFEERETPDAAEVTYGVVTGVLGKEKPEGGYDGPLVRWVSHIFVGDTLDGGSVPWLRHLNGLNEPPAKVWVGARDKSEEIPAGEQWPALDKLLGHGVNLKSAEGPAGDIPIKCHCGGVDLVFKAGDAQREFAALQEKGEKLPWFVDPVTHKLAATLDGCDSCRIWSGVEVYNWTFGLLKHITFAGADANEFPDDTSKLRTAVEEGNDPRLGTLAVYITCHDAQRYHCSRCSACVFYALDSRPDMVDIAVGLLHSPDGARAESVLSWSLGGQIGWRVDMVGSWMEDLLHTVEKESEEWRIERGYPKSWSRVAREKAAEEK